MALTIGLYSDSATVSTSEYSFPNDTTTGVPGAITTDGVYQLSVYVASIAAGDQFRFRIYEKLLSTQRLIAEAYVDGTQTGAYVFPALPLGIGWDMTGLKISGTDRTVEWCINAVT